MYNISIYFSKEQKKKLIKGKSIFVKSTGNNNILVNSNNYQKYSKFLKNKKRFLLSFTNEEIEVNLRQNNFLISKKGAMCSIEGNKYENIVYNIVKQCFIQGQLFNTQTEKELGGSTNKNDIICNYMKDDVNIEIKKAKSPDWMQCSIKPDNGKWKATSGKNSKEIELLFNSLIVNKNLFNGEIPPFFEKELTHEEWKEIKKNTNQWNDIYFSIPSDTIRKLYSMKGCQYIQISDGYGLYHLGSDICKFGVPIFDTEQEIRIRTKIHQSKNKKSSEIVIIG